MAVAKVTINNNTILDLTDATAGARSILSPFTAYIADGTKAVGEATGGGGNLQTKSVSYTPSETEQSAQVTADNGYDGLQEVDVTVDAISSTYVGSGITRRNSSDLSDSGKTVTVPAGYYASEATKSVTQTTHPNPTVSIDANGLITASHTQGSGYVTGGTTTATEQLTKRTSSDLTLTSGTFTAPSGYYPSDATMAVTTVTHPAPTVSIDSSGLITASHTQAAGLVEAGTTTATEQLVVLTANDITGNFTGSLNPRAEVSIPAGYAPSTLTAQPFSEMTTSSATSASVNSSGDLTATFSPATAGVAFTQHSYTVTKSGAVTTQAGSTITPTESQQTAVAANTYVTGAVNVGAISSSYVGSGVTRRSGTDVSISNDEVTVPAGYYESAATKAIPLTTHPDPTVSIDTNALITATHTQAAGYVSAGTTTATLQLTKRTSTDVEIVQNSVNVPAGYYRTGVVKTIPAGSAATPATTITANPTITVDGTTGEITAAVSASQSVTPSVSAGYVSSGTAGTVTASGSATDQLTVLDATDITTNIMDTIVRRNNTVSIPAGLVPTGGLSAEAFPEMASMQADTATISSNGTVTVTFSPSTAGIAYTSKTYTASKPGAVTVQGATTITPTTSQQTAVASGVYTTGAIKVDPIPSQYIIPSGSQTITTNNTYDVTALAEVVVNVAGSSGATYETGTYTPTSDTARPSISFSGTHSNPPILVAMSDTSAASGITSNSNVLFVYWDAWQQNGAGYPYSTSATRYSVAYYSYRSSNGTSSAGTLTQYNSSNTGSSSTSYSRYWADASGFHPYSNSTSRYWRANRNYKWIAVWKP